MNSVIHGSFTLSRDLAAPPDRVFAMRGGTRLQLNALAGSAAAR